VPVLPPTGRGQDGPVRSPAARQPDRTGQSDHAVTDDAPLPVDRFLNRELSWLDFNARVLALAEDPATPLLERVKFLAIFASNLDEFYMVRVAGLTRRLQAGLPIRGGDQIPLRDQLALIATKAAGLIARQADCLLREVIPALAHAGIHLLNWSDLTEAER